MVAKKLFWTGSAIYGVVAVGSMTSARATPQFARETGMTCNNCHRHIPLLNEFGQKFYANGFRRDPSCIAPGIGLGHSKREGHLPRRDQGQILRLERTRTKLQNRLDPDQVHVDGRGGVHATTGGGYFLENRS